MKIDEIKFLEYQGSLWQIIPLKANKGNPYKPNHPHL
jgi:hypothetical protein